MSETTEYDNLLAGSLDLNTDSVTVKQGQVLSRGAVLGIITAENKAVIVDSTSSDGSENPHSILIEDIDATDEDIVSGSYLSGVFNENQLSVGGTDTVAQHKTALRLLGIYIKTSVTT